MKFNCNLNKNYNKEKINQFAKMYKLDKLIIKLLFSRGYDTKEKISKFLNPNLKDFYNPYLLNDMNQVVQKIKNHLAKNSSITILGDYDADGISATAILYKYFESIGVKVNTFLPNRVADGYGLTNETVEKIKYLYNPDLIITVDCGISCVEEIEYCKNLGIDIIVTDHHDIPENIPNCLIINPKLPNQKYPFKELCGAGVAFKLIHALAGINEAMKYITLASIATVADLVPITDENRAIVYFGLKNQKELMPIGLQKLAKKIKVSMPMTATDISFKLAPKINATGRMGDASISFNLYVSNNEKEITKNIDTLMDLNDKRLQETNIIYEDSINLLKNVNISNLGIIVLYNENWESGVLGIICSKLVEMYNRPVCLLTKIDNELKGSVRSVPNIDIYEALDNCKQFLVKFGGHNQAGGLTLDPKNLERFTNSINEFILDKYRKSNFTTDKSYDFDLNEIADIQSFLNQLESLEPFGFYNERPVFKLSFNANKSSRMANFPNHLKINANNLNMVGFNIGDKLYSLETNCNKEALLDITIDHFGNKNTLKGIIKDLYFDKVNTVIKTELLNASFISQIMDINYKNPILNNVEIKNLNELNEIINNCTQNDKFGTLIICNTFESYKLAIQSKFKISNFELYKITNNTGINTILFCPLSTYNFKNYNNIIFFDAIAHENYLAKISNLTNHVYINNTKFDSKVFNNLSCDRKDFGLYHNALKLYFDKFKVISNDYMYVFKNMKSISPKYSKLKFDQFIFVLQVLIELNILVENNNELYFTSIKNPLMNSNQYKFINFIETLKR